MATILTCLHEFSFLAGSKGTHTVIMSGNKTPSLYQYLKVENRMFKLFPCFCQMVMNLKFENSLDTYQT